MDYFCSMGAIDGQMQSGLMPALFIGHGSPVNAIEDNDFSREWRSVANEMPRPDAILCISAHWETDGTFVTGTDKPRTIHDFGGFPESLSRVQYPAPGNPSLADKICEAVVGTRVMPDLTRGLDHGAWSVLMQMYPDAELPVVQLSLDRRLTPEFHYRLARELVALRRKGILILGSGNLVHNLRRIDWRNPESAHAWAVEANELLKSLISGNEHEQLCRYAELGESVRLAIPTPEHFLPLLYVLAMKQEGETIRFLNDRVVMGSLAMTSVKSG